MKKKPIAKTLKKKSLDDEAILIRRMLQLTPQQRWDRNQNFLRSLGFSWRSKKTAFGFKLPE